jgi:hypothetical protein
MRRQPDVARNPGEEREAFSKSASAVGYSRLRVKRKPSAETAVMLST